MVGRSYGWVYLWFGVEVGWAWRIAPPCVWLCPAVIKGALGGRMSRGGGGGSVPEFTSRLLVEGFVFQTRFFFFFGSRMGVRAGEGERRRMGTCVVKAMPCHRDFLSPRTT